VLIADQALESQRTMENWDRPSHRDFRRAFLDQTGVAVCPNKLSLWEWVTEWAKELNPWMKSDRQKRECVEVDHQTTGTLHGHTIPRHDYVDLIPPRHNIIGHMMKRFNPSSGIVALVGRIVASFISIAFLVVPMVVLTYINSVGHTLLAASLFAVVFAGVIIMSTSATSQDIFTITYAYAAVLVIFVGNALQQKS
jgi:vacuolar-type H+-ATPase subunit I/STV1